MRRIDRREFAKEASLAFLTGITVSVSACGGGGYSSPSTPTTMPPAPSSSGDEMGQISNNHSHSAVVQAAWLQAGNAVDLDIRGNATHSHMVGLVADAMRDLRDGKKVQKESTSTDGHTHVVTFNIENPDPPVHY
ncbi:MAG TPA: hypothetical protein VMV21_21625 [Vicinamibacteria bacterium]|nr:hypothetical protein [Vicinamibacteria bacterium]